MISLIQNFKVSKGKDILHTPEVLDAIKKVFGNNTYEDLVNHRAVCMEISSILCESPTKIEVRYVYNEPTLAQDLISESVFTYPENMISQIISTNATSGTIYLTIR